MSTLFDATLATARHILNVVEGAATGGTATTLIDTGFPWLLDGTNPPHDDYFNGGSVWFLGGNNSGKASVVTDWVRGTKTATFQAISGGGAVAANDYYAIAPKDYPLFILRQKVNEALQAIGNVDQQYSNAALVTVIDQMDYALPTDVHHVKRVEVATSTVAPYDYVAVAHWREIGGAVQFAPGFQQRSAGYRIRLTYNAPLARLATDGATIPDLIGLEYISWEAAANCLRWKITQGQGQEKSEVQRINEALTKAEARARELRPEMDQMPMDPKMSFWAGGKTRRVDDEIDLARLRP